MKKDEVNYRQSTGGDSCGSCKNYIAPDKCKVLEGVVAVDGLCDLFTPLEATSGSSAMGEGGDMDSLMSQLFGGGMSNG